MDNYYIGMLAAIFIYFVYRVNKIINTIEKNIDSLILKDFYITSVEEFNESTKEKRNVWIEAFDSLDAAKIDFDNQVLHLKKDREHYCTNYILSLKKRVGVNSLAARNEFAKGLTHTADGQPILEVDLIKMSYDRRNMHLINDFFY